MNKKLFTAVAVCALSAACAFGATACNKSGEGSGLPDVGPSVQVTEEQWNAALDKTATANNYTQKYHIHYEYGDYQFTSDGTVYYTGNERYEVGSSNNNGITGKTYIYTLFEGTKGYEATKYDNNIDWETRFWDIGDDQGDEQDDFSECVYSNFTYEDGKYVGIDGDNEVTIKFNAQGYISYVLTKGTISFMLTGSNMEISGFTELEFYNYNSTTLNVPADAKKAINDYKAANN